MQELILLGCLVLALIYLFRKLFKSRGCDCSSKGGCGGDFNVKLSKGDDEKS